MKHRAFLMVVSLIVSLTGCSHQPASTPKTQGSANLGVIEVTDGGVYRITSSDGRVFVVKSSILHDQTVLRGDKLTVLKGENILMKISEEQAVGSNRKPSNFEVLALPGEQVARLGEDESLVITVTAKIKHAPNKSQGQPPLALAVPLSRFTSRVGGGSAFYVSRHRASAITNL
ncbi:MAG TPA: hypothetical protein VIK35_08035 [Verrucomicrobiae bacterium]